MATFIELRLTKDGLSYYNYHWFWGLRLNIQEVLPNNMAICLDAFIQDKSQWPGLKEKYTKIAQRNFMVRFFYRLFNIDNFALMTHMIAAIKALYTLEKENMMPEIHTAVSWFIPWVYNFWFSDAPGLQEETPPAEKQANSMSGSYQPANEKIQNKGCMIDERMLTRLQLLGIKKTNGETLTLIEINHAYKQAAKKGPYRHPDKGGSKEVFCELSTAMESLRLLFCPDETDAAELSELWREEEEILSRAEASLSRTEASLAEMRASHAEMRESHAEMRESHAEMRESHAEMRASHAEMRKTLEDMRNTMADIAERLAKIASTNESYETEELANQSLTNEDEASMSILSVAPLGLFAPVLSQKLLKTKNEYISGKLRPLAH